MIEISSLIDELEDSISNGTEQRRLVALRRVSDMFVAGSSRYTSEQIDLFDDVLLRLANHIEREARVRLSHSLASMHNAPPKVVRSLAFDDAIEVAAPVLTNSPQLSDDDLVANARTKSQGHLLAISQRSTLSEAVTDVLVDRGDTGVVRSVAENSGARFSYNGFGRLVERSQGDEILAETVGARADLPRHHFLKLLESASAVVRSRLVASNPQAAALIRDTVAEISGHISREVRNASPEHAQAKKAAKKRYKIRQPTEGDVHMRAHAQDFEKTVVALALFGRLPIDLVERALLDERPDMVLILAKAAGCSRTTTKAILLMQAAGRGMSDADMEQALASFDRLSTKTAKRVLEFYDRRKAHSQLIPEIAGEEMLAEAVA
ncbi:DUF2336 domain-containing protein [Xanthobacteraceae bacterium Astr-EGSB]|uniref:DUF2336 domain-containing protein n=1 Tax=Astrobacterium formosum TaxID=3069710 RepID=UPI0027B1D983|nr:DUF2336 domain-containing protein [Xanthobacteraceae bacterium Astr-EGSB]